MTRAQLEHAIRAACDIADDTEVIIFGSQAILGTYANPPDSITASIEVDLQPKNKPANADLVDGALGECSPFHETHGFYVHGLAIDPATLPSGWDQRTVSVSDPRTTRGNIGHCLEVHDLAASKLLANREKDRVFVTNLLIERLIEEKTLQERVEMLSVDPARKQSMREWIRITMQDLG